MFINVVEIFNSKLKLKMYKSIRRPVTIYGCSVFFNITFKRKILMVINEFWWIKLGKLKIANVIIVVGAEDL